MPDKTTKSGRREEVDSPTSLLTIFLLSPTIGTIVATWRGIQRIRANWSERRTLETRAATLRARPYAHVLPSCAACGFGALRVVGDRPLRAQAQPAYAQPAYAQPAWAQPWHRHSPRDLRCDRPGCHRIFPHGVATADKFHPIAA